MAEKENEKPVLQGRFWLIPLVGSIFVCLLTIFFTKSASWAQIVFLGIFISGFLGAILFFVELCKIKRTNPAFINKYKREIFTIQWVFYSSILIPIFAEGAIFFLDQKPWYAICILTAAFLLLGGILIIVYFKRNLKK